MDASTFYYTDNPQRVFTEYPISAIMLDKMDVADRMQVQKHTTVNLYHALRSEALNRAQQLAWSHHMFVQFPDEWPELSDHSIRRAFYTPSAALTVTARGMIYEMPPPHWKIRVMDGAGAFLHSLGLPRPASTLDGRHATVIAGDGVVYAWMNKEPNQ